jgi:general secretion pathway protein E
MTTGVQIEPKPSAAVAGGIVDSTTAVPSQEFLNQIPRDFARRHLVISTGRRDDIEHLLVASRTPPHVPFNIGVMLQRPVVCAIGRDEHIASLIDRAFAAHESSLASRSPDDDATVSILSITGDDSRQIAEAFDPESDLLNTSDKGDVVRLVDLLLFEAIQRNASDLHIQPLRDRVLVRYRIDGVLLTVRELPGSIASAVISRIKIMSRLDVAETRAPQDGRASVTIGSHQASSAKATAQRRIDLRIASLPTTYGERIVIRVLDTTRSASLLSFEALGMPEHVSSRFLRETTRSSGIMLVTGPTGSGKTTTLYTTLTHMNGRFAAGTPAAGCNLNMMTIEDPVEYDLSIAGLAISQTQLNARKGMTFASGLRHILRQDPDVIMVGEIRDEETARIAVQASLTGHLVLSTLHTNDAVSAVARLLDLGVEPFLVTSSLSAVLAQRLVRRRHLACGGRGCESCFDTGYSGRIGVFEFLTISESIRELIATRASSASILAAAKADGMRTLLDEGQRLIGDGLTTSHEIARVISGTLDDELDGGAAA